MSDRREGTETRIGEGEATLRDLGFSSYEERAYRALLALGSATASEISEASEVPMGRIYDALSGLESHGAVRTQDGSHPTVYAAVEPEVVVDRVLEVRTRELRDRLERYQSQREELVSALREIEVPEDEFWTAVMGPEESMELLLERIDTAESSVTLVADTVSSQFELDELGPRILETLFDAYRREVDISILLSESVLDQLGRELGDGEGLDHRPFDWSLFELRASDDLHGNFTLIDDAEICIAIPNPAAPDDLFGMVNFRDAHFAARADATFERAWGDARRITSLSTALEE
ncbi:TrmB family transcriptional regulator [Halalkaliarchaeum desulfuricum]|nr:helix-turn-helix domain-containing protein [Halalkaliarchaeum desulfuricum]